MKLKLVSMGILCLGFVCLNADEISQKEILGKVLFMDKNLSKNRTQACATCHNQKLDLQMIDTMVSKNGIFRR